MTWAQYARKIITDADKQISLLRCDDVELSYNDRRKLINEYKPYEYATTSWGRKVWSKEVTLYMSKYVDSDTKVEYRHLSPLERMMLKAGKS